MKLTGINLVPDNGDPSVVLSFRNPNTSNPFIIKSVVGLDAPDISPRFYSSGQNNLYNLKLNSRQIVILIGLNPNFVRNQSYSDLRDQLYRMIASTRYGVVNLQLKNGADILAEISGIILKFESANFEKTQQLQITIECEDAWLRSPTAAVPSVTGLNPARSVIADMVSTAPHGFQFSIGIATSCPSLKLTDPSNTWSFEVTPNGGFLESDVFTVINEYYGRLVYLTRASTIIQLADVITPGSVWPIMFPGENVFIWTNPTSIFWTGLAYWPTYWGV